MPLAYGRIWQRRLMKDAEPGETFGDLGRRHGRAVVAHGGTRQAALQHRLRQAVRDVLRGFGKIPLQMADQPRMVIEHAEQHRCSPFAARRQHFSGTVMTIPMPEPARILRFIATHFTCLEPRRRRQRAFGLTRRHQSPLGQAVRGQESPNRRVGRHRAQLGAGLGQGNQILVMQVALQLLWALYWASSAWRSDGVIDVCSPASPRRLRRSTLTGSCCSFLTAIEPSLQRGDAEADRRAGARVTPFAGRQLLQSRAQRALRRRRRQKRTDNREAQSRPTLMHPRSASFRHARPPRNERADGSGPHRGAATRILCGSVTPVRKRASPMRRRSADRGSAARR